MNAQDFSRAARAHLERELEVLRLLQDCLRRERECLVALDSAGAARIAVEKEEIIRREQGLAQERRAIVSEAAALLSERSAGAAVDLSLGEIVERLRPPHGSQLMALRADVRRLAQEAQKMNAVNRQLCAHAVSCVRGYLGVAGRAPAETYGAQGRIVARAAGGGYARRF